MAKYPGVEERKNNMRIKAITPKQFVFPLICFVAGIILTASLGIIFKDRTIAVVDGTPVRQSQLYQAMKSKIGAAMLQKMIDNIVVDNTAKRNGIVISDQELEAEFNRKITQEYHSQEAFEASLAAINLSVEEAKEDLRRAMLFDRIAVKDINFTEAEVQQYYQIHKSEFVRPEMRQVREIVLKDETRAGDLRRQLLNGADFSKLAQEESVGLGRERGGDRGFIVKGALNQLPPEVEKAAFALQNGATSPVIKSADGFHLIKVEQILPESEPDYLEIKDTVALKAKLEKCRPFPEILTAMRNASKIGILDKSLLKQ